MIGRFALHGSVERRRPVLFGLHHAAMTSRAPDDSRAPVLFYLDSDADRLRVLDGQQHVSRLGGDNRSPPTRTVIYVVTVDVAAEVVTRLPRRRSTTRNTSYYQESREVPSTSCCTLARNTS